MSTGSETTLVDRLWEDESERPKSRDLPISWLACAKKVSERASLEAGNKGLSHASCRFSSVREARLSTC
jgi:hypothetical protein